MQKIPELARRSKTHQPRRPATPYRTSQRRRNVKSTLLTYEDDVFEHATPKELLNQDESHHPSIIPSAYSFTFMCKPPLSPTRSQLHDEGYEDSDIPPQYTGVNPKGIGMSSNIIDSIYEVVLGFPQHMLFLNSPCIVDIRHQNRSTSSYAYTQRLYNLPFKSSDDRMPLGQPPRASIRRCTAATKFFAPFFRAASTKASPPRHKGALYFATRPSSRRSTALQNIFPPSTLPSPDLLAFQHIFPATQNWWRGVLYAHLIAYNYVHEINTSQNLASGIPFKASRTLRLSQALSHRAETARHPDSVVYPSYRVPLKACRTLGIPRLSSNRSITSAHHDGCLADLENELASCITWITNCMSGKINSSTGMDSICTVDNRDLILVRSLAEIVRVQDRDGNEEVKAPELS